MQNYKSLAIEKQKGFFRMLLVFLNSCVYFKWEMKYMVVYTTFHLESNYLLKIWLFSIKLNLIKSI